MKTEKLLRTLKGIHTIESVMKLLNVDRQKAIYYIHRLRVKGYVKTTRTKERKRIYNIHFHNRIGGISYTELINKDSPVKLAETEVHRVHGKIPSHEELLIYSIKKGSIRHIIAGMAQFKKIKDWSKLYHLAKNNGLLREVGALYDLSRKFIKTRRMTKRFRNNALPKKKARYHYIIQGFKSQQFHRIEQTWKVYLPLNAADLEEYT